MLRAVAVAVLVLGACTTENPDYCAPGPTFAECVRVRLNIEGPPDLTGYQIVPLPDMVDGFQCIGPGEHCSDNGELRPGACCGNYICFATSCKPALHEACERDADCAPVIVGNDRSPAVCHLGHCMSQSGGACAGDSDCVSGRCGATSPPRCL